MNAADLALQGAGAAIWNVRSYMERFLQIVDKNGRLIPLHLNKPQERLYNTIREQYAAGKPVRIIILKARQMGFSTVTEGIQFAQVATKPFFRGAVVAHTDQATANLYRMTRRFYDNLPSPLQPMIRNSNAKELIFDAPTKGSSSTAGLGSRIRCATAGGKGVGRGDTLEFLHLSEFAFWPGNKLEIYTGLAQAVPDEPGTAIIIESTANGYNEFKTLWDDAVKAQRDGTEGFIPIFFAWFEMAEYRRPAPPGFQRTAEEEELAARFGLDDEQLAWRRWCIKTQCGGSLEMFHQEYPSTPDEAFISTGQCVFNKAALEARRQQVVGELWERGEFRITRSEDGKMLYWIWDPTEQGCIRIRKRPEPGVPYVIGGDTAGTGSDFFVGQVLDNRTGEQVAVLHHQYGERRYAEQMYCLGRYYNTALIGVETNYSTYPEKVLEELGYPKLYVRQRLDTATKKLMDAYGFDTNASTRPTIIDNLKDVARNALETITDYDTLGEMLTFVYDDHFRPQADGGAHDDLVLALAIAHIIRPQQRMTAKGQKGKAAVWSRDMYEDYWRATDSEKRELLQRWGRPEDL